MARKVNPSENERAILGFNIIFKIAKLFGLHFINIDQFGRIIGGDAKSQCYCIIMNTIVFLAWTMAVSSIKQFLPTISFGLFMCAISFDQISVISIILSGFYKPNLLRCSLNAVKQVDQFVGFTNQASSERKLVALLLFYAAFTIINYLYDILTKDFYTGLFLLPKLQMHVFVVTFVYLVSILAIRLYILADVVDEYYLKSKNALVMPQESDPVVIDHFIHNDLSVPKQVDLERVGINRVIALMVNINKCATRIEDAINVAMAVLMTSMFMDLTRCSDIIVEFYLGEDLDKPMISMKHEVETPNEISSVMKLVLHLRQLFFYFLIYGYLAAACQNFMDAMARLKTGLVEMARKDGRIWKEMSHASDVLTFTPAKTLAITRALPFQAVLLSVTFGLIFQQLQHDKNKKNMIGS